MKFTSLLIGVLIALALSAGAVASPDLPICDNGQCETEPPPPDMLADASVGTGVVEEISEAEAKSDPLIPAGAISTTTTTESVVSTAGLAARRCWRMKPLDDKSFWAKRGHLVYYRAVHQVSTWCATYGRTITFRRTTSWYRLYNNGALCRAEWDKPRETRVSGGVGFSWVTVRSEIPFSCWVPLWHLPDPTFYFTNSVDASYNAWGEKALVRSSY